jgi:NAD(P)-dependent dehydrogenase (short-subunit alcohol dehydrogenase family)
MGMLDGKVALVTGAGQGVGQGIAFALAREGAVLALAGRTVAKLEATRDEIARRGGRAIAVACDVKRPESLSELVETVVDALGTVDILVNNAQEVPLGRLDGVDDEAFEAGWQSGPLATFRLMKLCRPHLVGGGSIVNLASTAARRWDLSGYGAYAAVKESIRSLSRAAACEWAAEGIRTNVILPHAKSPGLEGWIQRNPAEAEAFFETIPMRRVGECEQDIGAFVALLCSEGARYVNGQSIAIDGGQAHLG